MSRHHRTWRFSSILTLALLLALGACVAPDWRPIDSDFEQAHRLYLKDRYDEALDAFENITSQGPGAVSDDLLAQSYRFQGECYKYLKDYTQARFQFAKGRDLAIAGGEALPEGRTIYFECATAIGDTYLLDKSFRIADSIFEGLLEEEPPLEFRDTLLYRRYICAVELERPDPEQYTRAIARPRNIAIAALRREFLVTQDPFASQGDTRPRLTGFRDPPPVTIIPRSTWRAAPTLANVNPMTKIRRITVHHTGEVWDQRSFDATAARIRAIQRSHQHDRNWADVGYHFLIDSAGRIWEGRGLTYQGAHAGNFELNRGNVGISLLGNFDLQRLNPRQTGALTALIGYLCHEYGLTNRQIATHRELKATACPGSRLQRFVDQLRSTSYP